MIKKFTSLLLSMVLVLSFCMMHSVHVSAKEADGLIKPTYQHLYSYQQTIPAFQWNFNLTLPAVNTVTTSDVELTASATSSVLGGLNFDFWGSGFTTSSSGSGQINGLDDGYVSFSYSPGSQNSNLNGDIMQWTDGYINTPEQPITGTVTQVTSESYMYNTTFTVWLLFPTVDTSFADNVPERVDMYLHLPEISFGFQDPNVAGTINARRTVVYNGEEIATNYYYDPIAINSDTFNNQYRIRYDFDISVVCDASSGVTNYGITFSNAAAPYPSTFNFYDLVYDASGLFSDVDPDTSGGLGDGLDDFDMNEDALIGGNMDNLSGFDFEANLPANLGNGYIAAFTWIGAWMENLYLLTTYGSLFNIVSVLLLACVVLGLRRLWR